MSWLHRTKSGRVVYERPRHRFSRRDLERIRKEYTLNAEIDDVIEVVLQSAIDGLKLLEARAADPKAWELATELVFQVKLWAQTHGEFTLKEQAGPLYSRATDLADWLAYILFPPKTRSIAVSSSERV